MFEPSRDADDDARPSPHPRADAAQRERARLSVLAEVGLLLASSGDHVDILQRLTEIAVPALCDWCAVHAPADGGELRRLAVRRADPHKLALFELLSHRPQSDPDARGAARVAATGASDWGALTRGEFYMSVPLQVRGRVIGVLSLLRSHHEYDRDDVRFVEEVARRVAMYVDNALLLREVHAREAALRDEASRLETLTRIGQELAALHELEDVLHKVCDAATALTGAEIGVFFTFSGDDVKQCVVGATPGELELLERARDELTADATVASLPGPLRVADLRRDKPVLRLGALHDLPRAISYLAVPVRGRRGDVLGAILLAHSRPSAFDARDEQLLVSLAMLTGTATDSARLFREARELIRELEKSNRDLDQFAAVISHDMRAPLRGISNLAAWLEHDLGDRLDPRGREHLNLLRGRVHRLDDMIQGVLAYSRAGRNDGEPGDVDTGALVRESIELLAPPEKVSFVVAPDLPVVRSSRVPLQQVFMNLIANAIKHNHAAAPRVEIGLEPAPTAWEFFVRDNGPGIAPRYHAKIWGLFQTLRSRDVVDSTGIGLALVRKIVEAHGGHASIESDEGRGATFRFTWPKVPPTPRRWG